MKEEKRNNFVLFTIFYQENIRKREKELITAIWKNIENPMISCVYLFLQDEIGEQRAKKFFKHRKVRFLSMLNRRMHWKDMYDYANRYCRNKVCIYIHTDTYYTYGALEMIAEYDFTHKILGLTPWCIQKDGSVRFNWQPCAASWIFKPPVVCCQDYSATHPGGDCRLTYELKKAGYKIYNPGLIIKIYHNHASKVRYYDEKNRDKKTGISLDVPGPYAEIKTIDYLP